MLGVHDEWAAFQFDTAVRFIGTYIENKMNEYKDGKPIYSSVEDILGPVDGSGPKPADQLRRIEGVVIEKR